MTYSIVARDPDTGEMGVAVQTCMFAVGSIVPWARAGIGAVATQSFAEVAYGPRCLDALARGTSAAEALEIARAEDPTPPLRQVGVVDAAGRVAAMTGDLCIDYAGDVAGDGFTVQANMMASPDVWPAMAAAYTDSTGPLAHRLLFALAAGEAAGGDARGHMSAALVVVEGVPSPQPGRGAVVNLRVDRSDDPIGDLAELLTAADAFAGFSRAVDQLMGGDPVAALGTVDDALALLPGEGNMRSIRSGALLASGATDAGLTVMRELIAERASWEVIIRGFVDKGLISLPEGLSIDRALE